MPKIEQVEKNYNKILELKSKWEEILSNSFEYYEKMADFTDQLKKKYPGEVEKCRLFHLLAGSSPGDNFISNRFDFDGDDSIEDFILHCHEEVTGKK